MKEELIKLRLSTKMNRKEFADYIGIPYRTLQDWELGNRKMPEYVLRLMSYYICFENMSGRDSDGIEKSPQIICDADGNKILVINDIKFDGRNPDWEQVEELLKEYVGKYYEIEESSDKIFIGTDFPDEYAHSNDTKSLRGSNIKAKANAVSGIPEMIRIATNQDYSDNNKSKHKSDARNGWYRYDTRFALPVYRDDGELLRYNVFRARMLVRHAKDGELYLYDFLNIKKGTCKPLEP